MRLFYATDITLSQVTNSYEFIAYTLVQLLFTATDLELNLIDTIYADTVYADMFNIYLTQYDTYQLPTALIDIEELDYGLLKYIDMYSQ